MNKQKLAEMFGIDTHEKDIQLLNDEKLSLAEQVAHYKVALEDAERELSFYKLNDEEKVRYLMEDVNDIEEMYKERITECDHIIDLAKQEIDMCEQRIHRAFGEGRASAYSEMGIWRLDAIAEGNCLVMDKNGDVYELLQNLEDVKADADKTLTAEMKNAIETLWHWFFMSNCDKCLCLIEEDDCRSDCELAKQFDKAIGTLLGEADDEIIVDDLEFVGA